MKVFKKFLSILYIIICLTVTFITVFHLYLRFGGTPLSSETAQSFTHDLINHNDVDYPYMIETYEEYENYVNNFHLYVLECDWIREYYSEEEFEEFIEKYYKDYDVKSEFPDYSPEVFEDNIVMVTRYRKNRNYPIYAWRGYRQFDNYIIKYYTSQPSYNIHADNNFITSYNFVLIPKADIEGANFIDVQKASKPRVINNILAVINLIIYGRAPRVIC